RLVGLRHLAGGLRLHEPRHERHRGFPGHGLAVVVDVPARVGRGGDDGEGVDVPLRDGHQNITTGSAWSVARMAARCTSYGMPAPPAVVYASVHEPIVCETSPGVKAISSFTS